MMFLSLFSFLFLPFFPGLQHPAHGSYTFTMSFFINAAPVAVHWHDDGQPVYAVAMQPSQSQFGRAPRVATAGGDNNVRIWNIQYEHEHKSLPAVQYLATLRKHTQAVNAVRFLPRGDQLASAGDDGLLVVWKRSDRLLREFGHDDDEATELWVVMLLHATQLEIYDVCWLPDGRYVATGAMDNITAIYDAETGRRVCELADHLHYVQGVAWDPLNEYLATQGADRTVHVYRLRESGDEVGLAPTRFFRAFRADVPVGRIQGERIEGKSGAEGTETEEKIAKNVKIERNAKTEDASSQGDANGPSLVEKQTETVETSTGSGEAGNGETSTKDSNTSGSTAGTFTAGTTGHVDVPRSPAAITENTSAAAIDSSALLSTSPSVPMSPPASTHIRPMAPSPRRSHEPLAAVAASPDSTLRRMRRMAHLYHPETLQSFFRRLAFSPDGALLVTPLGVFRDSDDDPCLHTVYIYTRAGLNHPPVCHVPGLPKAAVAVAFSPVLYESGEAQRDTDREGTEKDGETTTEQGPKPAPVFLLPYKMVFAVATHDAVYIYDTESLQPLAALCNLHYLTVTDLCWDWDGEHILVSSAEGFCSVISFGQGVFGKRYHKTSEGKELPKQQQSSKTDGNTEQSGGDPITTISSSKVTKGSIGTIAGSNIIRSSIATANDPNPDIIMDAAAITNIPAVTTTPGASAPNAETTGMRAFGSEVKLAPFPAQAQSGVCSISGHESADSNSGNCANSSHDVTNSGSHNIAESIAGGGAPTLTNAGSPTSVTPAVLSMFVAPPTDPTAHSGTSGTSDSSRPKKRRIAPTVVLPE